jgi:hypothetical protein
VRGSRPRPPDGRRVPHAEQHEPAQVPAHALPHSPAARWRPCFDRTQTSPVPATPTTTAHARGRVDCHARLSHEARLSSRGRQRFWSKLKKNWLMGVALWSDARCATERCSTERRASERLATRWRATERCATERRATERRATRWCATERRATRWCATDARCFYCVRCASSPTSARPRKRQCAHLNVRS